MRNSLVVTDEKNKFADIFQTRSRARRRTKATKAQLEQQHQEAKPNETKQVLDVPLITVNNLVFRCRLENGTYKPVELLSHGDLLKQLKHQEHDHSSPPDHNNSKIITRIRSLSLTDKVCIIFVSFFVTQCVQKRNLKC